MTTITPTLPRIHSGIMETLWRRSHWLFVTDENLSDFWVERDGDPFKVSVRYRIKTYDGDDGPKGFDHAGTFFVCCARETFRVPDGIGEESRITYPVKTTHADIPFVVDRCLAKVIERVNAHGEFIGVPEIRIPAEANTAGRPGGYRWETDHG